MTARNARIGLAPQIGQMPSKYRYFDTLERAELQAIELRMFFGTVRVEVRTVDGGWEHVAAGPLHHVARAVDLERLAAALHRCGEEVSAHWLTISARHLADLGPDTTIAVEPSLVALCEREGIALMTAITPSAERASARPPGEGSILPTAASSETFVPGDANAREIRDFSAERSEGEGTGAVTSTDTASPRVREASR